MYKTELSGKKPSCLKSLFAFHEALSSFKSPKRSTDGGGEAGGGGKMSAPWCHVCQSNECCYELPT